MEKLQQFAIGQRWLSDTETELGLGVLIDVDERSISILFPKSDETRVYARNNAPLSRIIFNINDEVQDQEGSKWLVESIEDRHGVLRYNVVRILESGEQERKALNETRIGAQIQLSNRSSADISFILHMKSVNVLHRVYCLQMRWVWGKPSKQA